VDIISVHDIEFRGIISNEFGRTFTEYLHPFSYDFMFGRSFLLDTTPGQGGWAVSWIIGGELETDSGLIYRNGTHYTSNERKKDAWLVRKSEIRNFWPRHQTVQTQIQHGLRTVHNPYFRSEEEFKRSFQLTDERYKRPFRKLSHEAWRASCAVGLANGRTIFCFPYVGETIIKENFELWFKRIVDLLKDSGSLILIPSKATSETENLCDEVILVDKTASHSRSTRI